MKKYETLTCLFIIACVVACCWAQQLERKISAISFEISDQEGLIFKQPIQTKLYETIDSSSNNYNVNEIDRLCDPPNTSPQPNSILQLFNTPFAYYFRMSDYTTFFGPVLSHKETCRVRVSMRISQQPTHGSDMRELDSSFREGLSILSDSNSYSNFHKIFGPFVATNIQYGDSSLTAQFKSSPVGIHQTQLSNNETFLPFKQVKNANLWFNNGKIVNFTITTLADFVKENNLASQNAINSLQKLQVETLVSQSKVQNLYESSLSNNPICENSRLFNLIEANLDSGFHTYIIAYAIQSYGITIDQIKNQYQSKGIFSNIKLQPIVSLSLDRNSITNIPIFKVNRAASSTIRESYLTTDETEAKSISSDYSILGYCSSIENHHPDMVPLYRFNFDRHYYRTNENGEIGWIRELLMCYAYPVLNSIQSDKICILN